MRGLRDSGLPLEPADITSDLLDIPGGHAFDLRHVAEFPMMSSDAELRRAQKRRVAVMIGLVDLMDEWRTLLSAGCLRAMTGGAMCVELGFTSLEFRRHRSAADSGLRLGRVTCRHGKNDRKCHRGQQC